nr:MAK10-like protein [Tanacetum cinerariifolium]
MEAHLAPSQPTQVNKITSSCEICSGPYDTQYCMENPEQAFVEYEFSRTDEEGDARLSKFEVDFKQQQSETTNKIDTVLKAITNRIARALPSDMVKNPKLIVNSTTSVLSAHSNPTEDLQRSTHIHGSINTITIHPKQSDSHDDKSDGIEEGEKNSLEDINTNPFAPPDQSILLITKKVVKKNGDSRKEELETGELEVEYFDMFPTRSELSYHKYLMCGPIPSIFLRNPIITEGYPSNLKIPCNIKRVLVEKAYIDLKSPLNIMTRMMYNWIMRRKLNPRENSNRGVGNFTGRIKGIHFFVGNFTYATDFMIVEDISSIIDPRLSQVVLGKPFVEISNMTQDPPEGVKLGSSKEVSMDDS